MSSIIEVLTKNPKIPAERLDVDVFREEGALRESALLDVRSDALAGAMFFLFDCRGSLFIDAGNTGALALFGVRFLCVKNFPERPRFWHTVATWSPSSLEQGKACLITFDMFSESSVSVYFSRGYFLLGMCPVQTDRLLTTWKILRDL